jgi:hypothetical protein
VSAKVFALPPDVGVPPELSVVGPTNYVQATTDWVKSVQDWVRNTSTDKDPVVGEVYRFPVADGYAEYVIFSTEPIRLIHLPTYDGWFMPEVVRRGLNLTDIRECVGLTKARGG